jgi:hypothetical protein
MTQRATGTYCRPRSDTARDRLGGNASTATVATRFGAPLAVPDTVERAARCPGRGRG